ncbi:MAG TPA: acyl-CoA dehydrogenase family protein [Anaeromyxobacter sp.]
MTEFRFADPSCITEELRMMRAQVRRLVEEEIVPRGEAWERDGKIARAVIRQLGTLGLLGMRHATEYGGTDLGSVASVVFAEELARSTFGGFTAAARSARSGGGSRPRSLEVP